MNKIIVIPIVAVLLFLIDLYFFQAFKVLLATWQESAKRIFFFSYWGVSLLSWIGLFLYNFSSPENAFIPRRIIITWLLVTYSSKFLGLFPLLIDDLIRVMKWLFSILSTPSPSQKGEAITRSEFLAKSSLVLSATPLATMSFGILSGAHDYKIRHQTIVLPNLPKAFDGVRFAQLSDIHSGSFFNKKAVQGGIEMLLAQKPDMVFFTGDLVNNVASEMKEYADIFGKIKAPLGVFSVTGNHDYGDYVVWESMQAKKQNFMDLQKVHKRMGWDLLMNENRLIHIDNEQIAILGVENWGAKGNFRKYGKLAEAHQNTQNIPVKILLSHDPSHWDAQVISHYQDIDLMLAGHTHGFQFGVEAMGIKWSPVQYMYEQWAGLYQKGKQYLYVNRGFGYIGFPGRIGILPEITLITLKKA